MTELKAGKNVSPRYGPLTFTAAAANIFVSNLYTWLLAPYSIIGFPILLLPPVLLDVAIAAILAWRPGKLGQIGRGMLIGLLSLPVALVVFIAGFAVAKAIGPI